VLDHNPLTIQTADRGRAAALGDVLNFLGSAVNLMELEGGALPRLSWILPSDPSRISHHPAQFLIDLFRRIREEDRVMVALAHLPPIQARELFRLGQKDLWLRKDRSIDLVKAAHDLPCQLHMRRLVHPYRDLLRLIHHDIRRLKNRISQETVSGKVPALQFAHLLLIGGVSLQPGDRSDHGEQ
jgi:hypothetical protein